MQRVAALLLVSLAAVSWAQFGAYHLPIDYELILSAPLSISFSCEGRPYGFYADQDNNCQIFHVCEPRENDEGVVIRTYQWTFICGNGTVFDQQNLGCALPENAFPCDQAHTLYDVVNAEFGRIPEPEEK